MKLKAVAVPSVEMFREYGQALRRKYETGPVQSTKRLLRRFVRRILADKGALKAELVVGKPRQHGGSGDESALSDGWWARDDHGGSPGRPFRIVIRVA